MYLEFEERTLLGLKGEMNNPLLQRLFANENVLLSPHVAGVTKESWFKLSNVLADKILNDFSPAVS
jgi:phosphoglycerate dehydrogenase-like enzyme